jgi:hypothetical protein
MGFVKDTKSSVFFVNSFQCQASLTRSLFQACKDTNGKRVLVGLVP